MIKKLLLGAALTLGLGLFQTALADGPYGGVFPDAKGGAFDNNFKFLGIGSNSAILNNERSLTFSEQFSTTDNGAGNTFAVDLLPVPINKGGTNGTTAQSAVNNLLGGISGNPAAAGDLATFNGADWALLHKGAHADGEILTLVGGSPGWSTASVSAPTTTPYITLALDGILSAERVLTGTPNKITLTDGGANGNLTLNVGSDIVQLTSTQTLTNKTLTSPSIDTSLIFKLGTFDTTVTATAPSAARNANIPDFGVASADFLMTQGAQTKAGALTLSAAPVLSTGTLTAGANLQTFPSTAQTLVGRTSTDVLTNKELTAPSLTSGSTLTLKQTSANYTIDWANPAAARAYHVRDRLTDADFAMVGNNETYNAGGAVYSDANTMKITAAGTSGHPLISGGTGAPAFNILGLAGGGTGAGLTASAGGVLYSGASVMAINTPGTSGHALRSGGTGAPTFGVLGTVGGGTNNGSLGVSAVGIYNGDGSKIVQTTGTALQQFRVNAAATAIEAFTPVTSASAAAVKTANETVNNSGTLQDDDHLTIAIGANETWIFHLTLFHDQAVGGADLSVAMEGPASSTVIFGVRNVSIGTDTVISGSNVQTIVNGTTGTTYCTTIDGSIRNSSTAGNLKFRWSQQSAIASNTNVLAGSCMTAIKQ